jgi:hypothetical protein
MQLRSSSYEARLFSHLSAQRQMLVRLCQKTNYGSIRGLDIWEGEPVFDRPPVVQVDLKLDADDPPRPEIVLSDFELSHQVLRLMERLDELVAATVELLEIRAGIPRRVVFRSGPSQHQSDLAGEASQ